MYSLRSSNGIHLSTVFSCSRSIVVLSSTPPRSVSSSVTPLFYDSSSTGLYSPTKIDRQDCGLMSRIVGLPSCGRWSNGARQQCIRNLQDATDSFNVPSICFCVAGPSRLLDYFMLQDWPLNLCFATSSSLLCYQFLYSGQLDRQESSN